MDIVDLILWVILWTLLITYYLLFMCGTFLEEGTGKIVLKLGGYHKTIFSKKDYGINKEGDIVPLSQGLASTSWGIGGWKWVGWWPIYFTFRKDNFRWSKVVGKEIIKKEEKNVEKLLIRDYFYGLTVENAETKDNVPTNSNWSITLWVCNLKKAWLDVEDWFSAVMNRIAPYIRQYIAQHSYQQVFSSNLNEEVWKTLHPIVTELKKRYGVEIKAIECLDINPDENYRQATLKKWEAQREVDREATTTAELIINMIASFSKQKPEEIQEEFRKDPARAMEKYEKIIKINQRLLEQRIAAERGELSRSYWSFSGAKGGLDLVAALAKIFGQQNPRRSPSRGNRKGPFSS